MQTLTNFEYHGKKAKCGGLCFDEKDRMWVFVSYCDSCHGKVVLTREEAEQFACRYCKNKNKLRTRILKRLSAKYLI